MKQKTIKINPEIAASYCMISAYAKNAEQPIAFVHYTHEHPVPSKVSYDGSSDMCTIFIFLEGKFGFLAEDVMYNPSYGNAMVFRNYEAFTSVFYTNSHVDYYQIELPAQFFDAVEVPALFVPGQQESRQYMLVPDRHSRDAIVEKLKQIEIWILADIEQTELLAYANILQILALLAQQTGKKEPPAARVPVKLKLALEYIHSNFATLSGIGEIADACGITSTYLSRMFRDFFQCTPNAYLNDLRISHAKYLLSTGSSLTDACYSSGFNNYTYFISKFKSITGITPAKFKTDPYQK